MDQEELELVYDGVTAAETQATLAAFLPERLDDVSPQVALQWEAPVPPEFGEDEVMAFVVPRPGTELDPEGIVRHLEPRLACFAIPRFLEFVDTLPLTENGKVKKYELRERGVGPMTWDREAAGVEVRR